MCVCVCVCVWCNSNGWVSSDFLIKKVRTIEMGGDDALITLIYTRIVSFGEESKISFAVQAYSRYHIQRT